MPSTPPAHQMNAKELLCIGKILRLTGGERLTVALALEQSIRLNKGILATTKDKAAILDAKRSIRTAIRVIGKLLQICKKDIAADRKLSNIAERLGVALPPAGTEELASSSENTQLPNKKN